MKRLPAIFLLLCLTRGVFADGPPMPGDAPVKVYKPAENMNQGAGAARLLDNTPAFRTFHLTWDYWSEGVIWNTVVTQWPVRLGVWYSTDWRLPMEQWTRIVDEPDASVTNATVTVPWSDAGYFRIGYSNTP